jgi:hypothetical protein
MTLFIEEALFSRAAAGVQGDAESLERVEENTWENQLLLGGIAPTRGTRWRQIA